VVALRPQLKKGAAGAVEAPGGSAVSGLNDAAFVVAGDLVSEVADGFRKGDGRAPTLKELCGLLVEALHGRGEALLSGAAPSDVAAVKAEVRKQKRIKAGVGDVVAIPTEGGGFHTAVILAINKYGVAYGIFEGASKLPRPVSSDFHPPPRKHPVYSTDEFVASGRWPVVGHDEGLRALFPAEPEMYYRKQVIPGAERAMEKIGPYGTARTASGGKRDLTQEEAEELGLLDGTYRQTYQPEQLEKHLGAGPRREREG
jgi:hypothetical protein